MADNDMDSTLVLDGDASGAEAAMSSVNKKFKELQQNKALDTLAQKAAEFAQRTGNVQTALVKLQGQLVKIGASEKDIEKVARAFDRNLVQAQKKAEQSAKDLARAEAQVAKEVERAAEAQRFGREKLGDASTTFGAAGSVVGAFGGNAGAEGLRLGGDLFGLAEYAGKFKDSVAGAGKQVLGFAGVTSNATGALVAGGAAMGALAVAGIALNAVLAEVEKQYQRQKLAADALNTILVDSVARQIELGRAVEEGNAKVIEAQYNEAAKAAETATAQLEFAIAQRDAAQKTYDETTGIFRGRDANIDSLNEKIEELANAAATAQFAVADYHDVLFAEDYTEQQQKILEFNKALDAYSGKLDKGAIETLRAAQTTEQRTAALVRAEELLAEKRDAQLKKIAELTAQQAELTAAYERQAEATIASRKLQDDRAAEDAGIASKRAQEDLDRALAEQATAHEANMLAIAKRGDDAIIAAQQGLIEKQAQAAQAIVDVQAQYQKEALKAERAFNKQRERDQREYRQALEKLEDEYNKRRLGAILDNDVLAFLENQSQFKSDKGQLKQDRRDERQDNRADFDEEQAERLAAAQERIAQIESELAAFTIATQQKIAEIEKQTAIELELAQKAFDDKLAKDQALRDIQNERDAEDAALRASRQAADRKREDDAAAAALQANLDKIESRKQSEIDALEILGGKATEVRAAESLMLDGLLAKIRQANTGLAGSQIAPAPLPTGSAPYVPSPGSKEYYEDPGQGPAGQGGGGFGAGFSGVSSVGSGGSRGGGLTINVQPRVMEMSGLEFVLKEDFDALIETIKAAWREKEVNLS